MTKLINQIEDSATKEIFDGFIQNHIDELNEDFPEIEVIKCISHCGEYEPMRCCFATKEIMVCSQVLNQFSFTKEEIFACIAHEFGHLKNTLQEYPRGDIKKEVLADAYASKLGYKEQMLSVIEKFIAMKDYLNFPESQIDVLNQRLSNLQNQK